MPVAARPARFQYFIYDNVEKRFVRIHDGFVCGRSDGELQFPSDDVISRKQCRFTINANDVYIEDLGSTNRTKVNRVALLPKKRRRLQLNDVIEFGRRRFILTNQEKFEPGNFEDHKTSKVYKAHRKSDGSLTSQISRLITMQTKVLLDRRSYSRLRVREFTQLRGWDSSTVLAMLSLIALWILTAALFVDRGAFTPGLLHSAHSLATKLALVALPWTALMTLVHYLAIRKRYKRPLKRIAFVPVWLVMTIIALPLLDWASSVVTDATENVVELHCVKSFSPDSCRPWAREETPGFSRLPRDVQESILAKLQKSETHPLAGQGSAPPAVIR